MNTENHRSSGRQSGRRTFAFVLGLVAGVGASAHAAADIAQTGRYAEQQSALPVAERSGWAEGLIDPREDVVYPAAITVEGNSLRADNADLLRAADGQCASITAAGLGGGLASNRLVVDFGLNTGGVVELGLCDGTTAAVHIAYAERRDWLNKDGDYSGKNIGADDDPAGRSYDVAASQRGPLVLPGIQGAQRWLSISLNNAGLARLDYIRIRPTHLRVSSPTRPGYGYGGQFLSSDPLLNRIWAQSAYTMSMIALKDPTRDRYVYVDGAKRDRVVWLGDVGNEGLAAYYSHREGAKIMKATLGMFACQQFPDGYLPMNSQIDVACADDYSDLAPDGPPPHPFEPQQDFGRLGEYTAWWVIGVADYYLYTGDKSFAQAMLPVARRTIDFFESKSNRGLYCTGQLGTDTLPPSLTFALGPFGEALDRTFKLFSVVGMTSGLCIPANPVEVNWHPFDIAAGEDMHTNAVIYRAYQRLAALEREIGQGEPAASRLSQLAETRRQAMLKVLWDEAAGAFKGNSLNPRMNHTQDGNVEALLGGVITGAQADRVMSFINTRLQGTYGTLTGEFTGDPFMEQLHAPFIGSRELVVRLSRHDSLGALNQLRRLWGQMVSADPASTLWERVSKSGDIPAYNVRLDPGGSLSLRRPAEGFTSAAHGWGAGPLNAMTGYLVGIRPVRPGFSTWEVEPQPGDLAWAQGQVTAPAGVIAARWTREGGGFRMTVAAPSGTKGRISVPLLGSSRVIAMNGRVAWIGSVPAPRVNAHREGDYVVFEGLAGGVNTFAW